MDWRNARHRRPESAIRLNALLLAREAISKGVLGAENDARGLCERLGRLWTGRLGRLALAAAEGPLETGLDELIAAVRKERSGDRLAGSVLIVDDDPAVSGLLEELCRPYARSVHVAPDLSSAARVADLERLSAVILDLSLPDGDGRDFLVRLAGDPIMAQVPVCVLTGHEQPLVTAECLALGAQEVHTKPLDPVLFAGVISVLLGFDAPSAEDLEIERRVGLEGPEAVRRLAEDCVEQYLGDGALWCAVVAGGADVEGLASAVQDLAVNRGGAAYRDGGRVASILPRTTGAEIEGLLAPMRRDLPQSSFGVAESGSASWETAWMIARRLQVLAAQAGGLVISDAPHDRTRPRVVLVDDDELIGGLVRAALDADGVELAHLTRGERLIEACRVGRPSLVILDVDLPDVDGLELLRQVRELPGAEDLPVLLLTGHNDGRYVEAAFAHGANDFVAKPFDLRDLRARVMRLIGRGRV